jgi:Oxygenase domain of the 2OGFeDO superfamily
MARFHARHRRGYNMLLQLIEPKLFEAGMSAIQTAKQLHHDHQNIHLWNSVIVNRMTPPHRDGGGWKACFDFLVAAGTYETAYLELADIGAKIQYNPGTVVAITGKNFRHAVKKWEGGERICYAHYMRNNIHNRLCVEQSGWVKEEHFTRWMSKWFLNRRSDAY